MISFINEEGLFEEKSEIVKSIIFAIISIVLNTVKLSVFKILKILAYTNFSKFHQKGY